MTDEVKVEAKVEAKAEEVKKPRMKTLPKKPAAIVFNREPERKAEAKGAPMSAQTLAEIEAGRRALEKYKKV